MFIELPPFSASPSDPNAAADALFDQHTLTLEPASRAEAAGRMRTGSSRGAREAAQRLQVPGGAFELTYTTR